MEIVSIHIGQTGVQIGDSSWQLYCKEHGIQPDGQLSDTDTHTDTYTDTVFSETRSGKHVPRAVFLDLEPTVIHGVASGVYRDLYSRIAMVTRDEDASSLYSIGHYSQGRGMVDEACHVIRKQVEKCDHLQGFMIYNSLGGGTGSGFTSLLGHDLNTMYRHCKTRISLTIAPSPTLSPVIVEPYNGVLGVASNMDYTSAQILFDNEALYGICRRYLNIERPSYPHLNKIISLVASSLTASTRFRNSSISTDFNSILTNTVPYPRIKYLTANYSPLTSVETASHQPAIVSSLTRGCFDPTASTLSIDWAHGRMMSTCVLYRGLITAGEMNNAIADIRAQKSLRINVVKWQPTRFKLGLEHTPPYHDTHVLADFQRSVCALTNHFGIECVFDKMNRKYDLMYAKRAFLHWYHQFGMEKDEFACSREELSALEMDYRHENSESYCFGFRHKYRCLDEDESDLDSDDDTSESSGIPYL